MFMRIGIAGEGKTPLVTPALPVSAPDVGRQGMARSAKYPIDQYSDTGNG